MNKELFLEEVKKINVNIDEEILNKFEVYKELLKEYGHKFNLTAILDDENIYLKHFYDSLCLLRVQDVKTAGNILDIGTGAGFPGMVIAIVLPNIKVTLVESNAKKCDFLNIVKDKLSLNNVEVINTRAEDYSRLNREKFDIVTSRAVSSLPVLMELEVPSLKVGGLFLPLKSHIEEELEISKSLIDNMDLSIEEIITYYLPVENSQRSIIIIKKNKETNSMYPRDYSRIIKDLKNK